MKEKGQHHAGIALYARQKMLPSEENFSPRKEKKIDDHLLYLWFWYRGVEQAGPFAVIAKLLHANLRPETNRARFKGTLSWDRFQKIWKKFVGLGLTKAKGRGWFFIFVGPPNYKWSIIEQGWM